jgi:nicotinamidase-related amidase
VNGKRLDVNRRRQVLEPDERGYNRWRVVTERKVLPAEQVALLLCDVWDHHWSRGASERVDAMAPRMNEVVRTLRALGVTIIHAPSDTMSFYEGTPARQRMIDAPPADLPSPRDPSDPPLPIDDSDGGSDTGEPPWHKAWTRQHPAIEIDPERDGVSESGAEIYGFLKQRGVQSLLIMGVHTNMCVLHRSFAIKAMVRAGVDVTLIRDLTDAMYNPAMRPYVSHQEGTRLVVEYIEKFWCPTIESEELVT